MIRDNQTVTRNTRTIVGPFSGVISDTDDIINVDTTLGAVDLYLQNIQGSGLMLNPRCVIINDTGLNASVNNINVYPSGGDLVNSGVVVAISVNGANAKCTIANNNEWSVTGVGVVSSGIAGSGTVNRIAKFVTPSSIGDSQIFDNGVSVGIGTLTPNASSIFDLTSTTKGFLSPRMTTAQRNAIATPSTGLLIYNTDANTFNYFDGVSWSSIGSGWNLNGNTVVSEKFIGTIDNFDFPIRTNNVEVARFTTLGQLGIGVGVLNASAKMQIDSTTQGFLTPRMTTAQRNAIATPSTGLLIYNTDTNAFNFYNGTIWTAVGTDITLYNGNGTIGTNRVATLTDNLTFNYVSGAKTTQFGVGADPFGWGQGGILNYFYDTTPGSVDAWGGLFDDFGAGSAAWLHEVYNTNGDSGGFFTGYSVAQTNPYSSLYHFEGTGGTYRGFEANKFGEQLYSQRLGLVTTALTAADRVLFVSNAGGYLKATTYADLVTQLGIPTIYSADGTISSATRNVTINTTLNFLHGAAGVNGKVEMTLGGYFKNSVAPAVSTNTYFEYNHNTGSFTTRSDVHTVTGFKATRIGTLGNPTADVELFAGSNGDCYMNLGATTSRYFTLVNGNISQAIYISTGVWSIGNGLPDHSVGLTVYGKGGTSATASQVWKNSSGIEVMRMNDAGQLGINTVDFSSGAGGLTNRLAVRGSNGDYGYHTLGFFENSLNPTANNSYYQRALTASVIKYGTFNTYQMVGSLSAADIQGGGVLGEVYGQHNYIIHRGAATVTDMAGIYADKQIQSGVVTNFASIIANTTQLGGGTITNMYGLWVKTPTNVSGGTRTNTYGILVESNLTGTNNYGVVSSGQMSNGFGTATPSANALVELSSTTKAFLIMRMTAVEAAAITPADGMMVYVTTAAGAFTVVGFWGYENGTWTKL